MQLVAVDDLCLRPVGLCGVAVIGQLGPKILAEHDVHDLHSPRVFNRQRINEGRTQQITRRLAFQMTVPCLAHHIVPRLVHGFLQNDKACFPHLAHCLGQRVGGEVLLFYFLWRQFHTLPILVD